MAAPRHFKLSLFALQFVTLVTLVRSVALDRWITVAASLLLLGATVAARRGRTWGVALAMMFGVMFTSLWAMGVAPPWFVLVGLLAVRPFVRLFRHFVRFDRGAAVMLATIGSAIGAAGALAWKEYASAIFRALPLLAPSLHPHHLPAILAALGLGMAATRLLPRPKEEETTESAAAGERLRIAPAPAFDDEERAALEELEAEERSAVPLRRAERVE